MLDEVDVTEDSLIDTLKCLLSKFEKPLLLQTPTVPIAIGITTAVGGVHLKLSQLKEYSQPRQPLKTLTAVRK